jgi:hypothetical protein
MANVCPGAVDVIGKLEVYRTEHVRGDVEMAGQTRPEKQDCRQISKVVDIVGLAVGAAVTPLALALLAGLAGCTGRDASNSQCNTEDDCTDRLGADAPYMCIEHVCERPSCQQDADCRGRGGRFATSICSVAEQQCVPAECTTTDGCGQGLVCDLGTNRCVVRECLTTQDCLTADRLSPTVQCIQGFCKDEVWGCIGKPDDRPRTPGATSTLEFQLLSVATNAPIPDAVWDIKVCGDAQFDYAGCDVFSRPPGAASSYDPATGLVRITGLNPLLPVRIWIDETNVLSPASLSFNGRAFLPLEFLTQKPPVGVTRAAPVRVVSWEALAAFINSATPPGGSPAELATILDRTKTLIHGTAFDCQDNPAAFVQPSYRFLTPPGADFPITNQLTFYLDEAGRAHQAANSAPSGAKTAEWTFGSGDFTTLNLPPSSNLYVETSLLVDGPTRATRAIRERFAARLTLERMTTIHFYPRDYTRTAVP